VCTSIKDNQFFSYRNVNFILSLYVCDPLVQTGSGAYPASYQIGTGGKAAGGVKLITHFHLVLRSRKRGSIIRSPTRLHGVMLN
jgi:hypothetical protein